MSTSIANFASCLGKYDATLSGTAVMDISGTIGNSDLSMNTGYLTNTTGFVMPSAINGNGISFSGWFNPNGAEASNYTPIFDISCSATQSITLCVSGNSLTPALVGNYNGNQVYQATGITANAWNFFTYTICCSGASQQLVQNLYVNNNTVSVTGGTYTALTFANSNVGYGTGIFANYFNGKIDDFRYYGRVITPMEVQVLNSYAYGKSTVSTLVPSLGTITYTAGLPTSVPFVFTNTGTYSYLQYKRIGNNGTAYMGTLSPSAMVPSGQTYTWTDTTVVPAVTYLYTWTPYILGTPGLSSSVQSIYTLAPASAFTGFTPSAFTPTGGVGGWTGFTLTWTGGVGTSINYLYYINNTPITANYTGSGASQTLTFTGLTAPTSGTTPTAYAWYVDICANNLAGTTKGTTTVYAPPTAITGLTSSYNSTLNQVTLTWADGLAGTAVTYSYNTTAGTASPSTGTITSPATISVTSGSGPWTFVVTAANASGSVNASTTATASPFTVNSVSYNSSVISPGNFSSNGILNGTSTTSGVSYNCYGFLNTASSYAINVTTATSSIISILSVGGGGSGGGSNQTGGGGAGGVLMSSILLSAGTQTITVAVGAGGAGVLNLAGNNGSNTTVSFSTNSGSNITAYGGGRAAGWIVYNSTQTPANSGGSGGGGGMSQTTGGGAVGFYNYGNNGGNIGGYGGGGGGGAGSVGGTSYGVNNGGNGGIGIQCSLNGVKDWTPSGKSIISSYYWGGGGGGCITMNSGLATNLVLAQGGVGGGGGGVLANTGYQTTNTGGAGFNNGSTGGYNQGNNIPSQYGGNAGANTGGGGGGAWDVAYGGSGGSGIVIIAFPQAQISVVTLTVTSVSSTGFTLNFASVTNATSYQLYVNNVLYGSAITAGTNNTITATSTTNFFVIDFYAKNVGGTLIAEGHSTYNWSMAPFTTITGKSVFTPTTFIQLSNTTYGTPLGFGHGVAVNQNQSKLLLSTPSGIYYSTSSDGGTTWATLTSLFTQANNYNSVILSADGTRGVFASNSGPMYYINWSGATPTAPVAFTGSPNNPAGGFGTITMTPDGTKVVCGTLGGSLHYGYWNGSGFTYFGTIATNQGTGLVRFGCSFSNDGNAVFYIYPNDNTMYYLPISGTLTNPTTSSPTQISTTGYDSRGLVVIGGGINSAPSYIMNTPSTNSPWYFATFNPATKTAGTFSTTLSPNGSSGMGGSDYGGFSYNPCGPYGNIIYFVENYTNGAGGSNFNISKVTYTVS